MKMCAAGRPYTTTTDSREYAQLVRDSEMLSVIQKMLESRLDDTGYAKIGDICALLGIRYVNIGGDDDE